MIRLRSAAIAAWCAVLGMPAAAEYRIGYMPPFPEDDLSRTHVTVPSIPILDEHVDGQWQGIAVASDGRTYFSVSSHSPRHNAQGKIHSDIFEYRGTLYCTTTSAHTSLEHRYPGGHFLAYDLADGALRNLGRVDLDGKGGLLSAVFDPAYERIYAVHQHQTTLVYYDLRSSLITVVGPVEDGQMQCRSLIVDSFGHVDGSTRDGMIWRYDPATGQ